MTKATNQTISSDQILWQHIIISGLVSFLCLSHVPSCFPFSLSFPPDSQMTSEQIEQNINCRPNLC